MSFRRSETSPWMARSTRALFVLSFALPVSCSLSKGGPAPNTLDEILDAMTNRARAFPSLALHGEIDLFRENSPSDLEHYAKYVFEQRHDGDRFDSAMSWYSPNEELLQQSRRVFTGEQYLYRQSVPELIEMAASFHSPKKARSDFGYFYLWGAVLHEQLPGDHEPIVSILRRAKSTTLREEMDLVEGFQCHVIEASTDHGTYQLWVDPAADFRIRRAVVRKRSGDLQYGKPIPAAANGDPFQAMTADYEISKVTLENIEGHSVPVSETLRSVTTTGDGRTERGRVVVTRSDVRLWPEFGEGAFVMDGIPEGARVDNSDPENFGYGFEWRGGDGLARRNGADRARPGGGAREWRARSRPGAGSLRGPYPPSRSGELRQLPRQDLGRRHLSGRRRTSRTVSIGRVGDRHGSWPQATLQAHRFLRE